MNCLNYQEFVRSFGAFCIAKKTGDANIISEGRKWSTFEDNIKDGLRRAHIFEVPDEVKDFLATTSVPKDNSWLQLPFPAIFIDVRFTREELERYGIKTKKTEEVVGIIIRKGHMYFRDSLDNAFMNERDPKEVKEYLQQEEDINDRSMPTPVGENLRITMFSKLGLEGKEEVWFDTFNKNTKLYEKFKDFTGTIEEVKTSDKKVRNFIHRFVLSFLNFCNTPDVTYIRCERSDKNQARRVKKGLIPLPDSFRVLVKGELKRYVSEHKIASESQRHFGYAFDVKGTWRHYMSERYKEARGQVRWVKSHRRGQGIYVKKEYELMKE